MFIRVLVRFMPTSWHPGRCKPEEAKEMVAAYRRSLESGIPPRQTALIEGKNPLRR